MRTPNLKDYINNEKLLATSGLRVVHVRGDNGAVTVAFRQPFPGSRDIEIATAITHPRDVFQKKQGTKRAIENFLAGHTIHVPDAMGLGAVGTLRIMFS